MYYSVYRIENKINKKYYIGFHKSQTLYGIHDDEEYKCSGKYINNAIKKYGWENFDKRVLWLWNDEMISDARKKMEDKEKELVVPSYIDPMSYNLKGGGFGGFDHINNNSDTIKRRNSGQRGREDGSIYRAGVRAQELLKDPEHKKKKYQKIVETKRALGQFDTENTPWYGKHHKDESKEKIGVKNSVHQSGEGNSNYGKMWINNGIESKTIHKDSSIPEGWEKGRICTWKIVDRSGQSQGSHWINNGKINKRLPQGQDLPNGFVFGKILSEKDKNKVIDPTKIRRNFIWINNGEIQRNIPKSESILNGWVRGMLKRGKSVSQP